MRNPEENRRYQREWYHRNQEKKRQQVSQRVHDLTLWIKEQKVRGCDRCGETEVACLDFHHRDPAKKTIEVAHIVRKKGWGPKRILEEIAKCDLLCCNCHRKEHALLVKQAKASALEAEDFPGSNPG